MTKDYFLKRVLPPLVTLIPLAAVALMIFGFSAQTGESSDRTSNALVYWIIGKIDTSGMTPRQYEDLEYFFIHGIRKTAHFLEYLALGFFLCLHLKTFLHKLEWLWSGAACLLYAAGDEFHQFFVGGRSMQFSDVFIDFAGAVCGVAFLYLLILLINRYRKRIQSKKDKLNT